MKTEKSNQTFTVGRVYCGTYITNSDLTVAYRVTRRTAKTVWVIQVDHNGSPYKGEKVLRRAVKVWSRENEVFMPDGNYSMALSIHADELRGETPASEWQAAHEAAKAYKANQPPALVVLPRPARCAPAVWLVARVLPVCRPAAWSFDRVAGI